MVTRPSSAHRPAVLFVAATIALTASSAPAAQREYSGTESFAAPDGTRVRRTPVAAPDGLATLRSVCQAV